MTNIKTKIAVLIVAGGVGSRMQHDLPKQYLNINGKTILHHTIDVFKSLPQISKILTVIASDHEDIFKKSVPDEIIQDYCFGGMTRQESVFSGLKQLNKGSYDYVLIHDAARPCVKKSDVIRLIEKLISSKAVTLALPITETIQRNEKSIDRENLFILQTPQGFIYDEIYNAHKHTNEAFTDDITLYKSFTNNHIHYVSCGRHNLKITTQDDLEMAEKLLTQHTETVTGQGFDVHAFDGSETNIIRLCGIDIPFNKSLEGHSDADIGLHVLTDAILSALAENDIGHHFPSDNNDYKNMDSHNFLDKAIEILKEKNGELRHIDITFVCQKPNISKYRDNMRQHLSKYLGLPINRISIKGTTSQTLGFTGREEGIAAMALATVRIPEND